MRLLSLGIMLCLALPAWGGTQKPRKQVCGEKCDSDYGFCQTRATTKDARKACKTNRKNCKKQCTVK
jgi:hypothetical protein